MKNDHKRRTAARHAGRRQKPLPHEHNLMARGSRWPQEGSPAEERSESPSTEAAEVAAGND